MIVVTFFTHHSAQMTHKMLKKSGVDAKMAPVPRSLSSSCGSCVFAQCDSINEELLDEDFEAVYSFDGNNYIKIISNE